MSKKPDGKTPKEKPFYRPFEALIKEKEKQAGAPKPAEARPGDAKAKPAPAAPPARPAPSPAPPPAAPPPAEPESFADLLYGVKPLDPRAKPRAPAAPPPPAEPSPQELADAEAVREHLRSLVSGGDARFEIHDDGLRIEGRRVDVDAKLVRRLRRGELVVDGSCDLHGLTVHEGRARVEEAVARGRQRGDRVLLLVHGKGMHSPGGRGVLRGEIAAWLSQGPASVHVAAFTTALPDDGGDGALYVLLRR